MNTLNTIIEEGKEAQKTNEEIINAFRNIYVEIEEVMERSVLDKYEMFLQGVLTLKDEAHRKEIAALEQSWMSLKDDYSEICRALGFQGDAWFGDPLEDHAEILARAKSLTTTKEVTEELPTNH